MSAKCQIRKSIYNGYSRTPKRKAARRRLLNSNLMMDQTNLNVGFDLRRYAMKPTPAKPRIIIAQVEGSGTGATDGAVAEAEIEMSMVSIVPQT